MNNASKASVLLVDDHAVVRSGLTLLINSQEDMKVVGEAADGNEAILKALNLMPDIVIMDLSMPHGRDGFTATSEIKDKLPNTHVLILTMHEDEEYLFRALQVGASGYILKSASSEEVLRGIRTSLQGGAYLTPTATQRVIKEYLQFAEKEQDKLSILSDREQEVLTLVATGYSNKEIADQLFLSVKTVENHKAKIMEKLNLSTRPELVRFALKNGMIDFENS